MAGVSVTVRTGAITATLAARDVPREKWNLLLDARKMFLEVGIPADCRYLFDFIKEARDERMWEGTKMVDVHTREYRSFQDLSDLVCNGIGINQQVAEWAIAGLKSLRPQDADRAITLAEAVYRGARDLAADRREAIAKLIGQNPPPTQQQIAEAVGLKSQSRVSEIIAELSAATTTKLLNHGGKRDWQGVYTHVERGTDNKDYTIARLKRDGRDDLAEQVGDGKLSARQAGMMAGFVKPQSALTALKREWRKASVDERQAFLARIIREPSALDAIERLITKLSHDEERP